VDAHLQRSIYGYSAVETGRDFRNRKRPTGDITTRGDVRLPDVVTCIAATETFVTRTKADGLRAHGFWRLDERRRRSGIVSPTCRHDSRLHAGLQGDRKLHAHRVLDSSKIRHTCSRPCAISEIESSTFSMPTEIRISASVSPISSRNSRATPESVIEAGCEISVLAPPN
jgi:hypothetical protein